MTYLDRILDAHRQAAARDTRDLEELHARAEATGSTRAFAARLAATDGLGVIAEIKRRSPSKGDLNVDLDPAAVAQAYVDGGASALSVLTDTEFFGGSASDLASARGAVTVPILRKDFTVCARDVLDARIMGADAILLIVAALDDRELAELHGLALGLGMDVLVETHDEVEVERALRIEPRMIGVNQRDLVTFDVDTERAERVVDAIPEDVVKVAESGIDGPGSAARLARAGFDAVLVGEAVVTAADPSTAIRALRGAE